MRRLLLCGVAALSVVANGATAATLNKCIDARGKVTYSNLPCPDARETRAVEIDAAPVAAPAPAEKPAPPPTKPASAPPANIRLDTQRTTGKPAPHAWSRRCDALTDELGRLFDKMDQARRSGYTQKQMDAWNQEVKALERKKQQAHCF